MLKKGQINSLHSTKSLVPPLHKFTIQNIKLILLPFFKKLNSLNNAVYLLTCQYFRRVQTNLSSWKLGLHFADFFIVQVKKICYERKVRAKLLGCFFHSTMEWLHPYVTTTSFRLIVLQNSVKETFLSKGANVTMKHTSHPVIEKCNEK